jgi:hypothetical protein
VVFGNFRPVARLVGTAFRVILLSLIACIALVVARRGVEGSAQRVTADPVKTILVGLTDWKLVPVLVLTAIVLAISLIGIPLLLLLPFAIVVLLAMAVVGFSGTACMRLGSGRVGGSASRRPRGSPISVLGSILLPLLLGRVLALGGWPLSPAIFLLVATGLAVEFLAWSSGFGAVLANTFSRWQATRAARSTAP